MTYKLNPDLLQKLRNGEIAIDNEGNDNTKLLRQIIKAAFPNDKMVPVEGYRYYYVSPSDSSAWNHTNMPIVNSTVPLNDFIQKGVVVGYKVKPAFAWCAKKLFEPLSAWDDIADRKCTMLTESEWYAQAKTLGVLDLWFDIITEEPKEEKNSVFVEQQRMITRMTLIQIVLNDGIPQSIIEGLVQEYDK